MDKAASPSRSGAREVSFDYLRAFIVLLVILHHSVLAYAAVWPTQPEAFTILSAPIVDSQRWIGFDLLAAFNDAFFMSLMFLLSGLFVWPSLERKGGARFLSDRALRLGLPFIAAAGVLMPLAYYPSYSLTNAAPDIAAYARAWLSLGFWPSGPNWFIWLLLVFDAAAAGLYYLFRHQRSTTLRGPWHHLRIPSRPSTLVVFLLAISVLVYVPMELSFGEGRWLTAGPFSFQLSRVLLYAAYFLIGVQMGAGGMGAGFLGPDDRLARQWWIWLSVGLGAYVLRLAILATVVVPVIGADQPLPLTVRLLNDLAFVLCCSTLSVAFIALFRRFAVVHQPFLSGLAANSYGMYLVHYPVVIWLQLAVVAISLSPISKGAIVFVGSVALSWGMVVALRRIRVIARIL